MPRPTTTRVVTPKDREKKRDDIGGEGLKATIGGVDYSVVAGEICAADISALRRATGYSFAGLMTAAATDPDIDVFAAIVWLSRRADGERTLSYDEVARGITYDDITEEEVEEAGEDASPEA